MLLILYNNSKNTPSKCVEWIKCVKFDNVHKQKFPFPFFSFDFTWSLQTNAMGAQCIRSGYSLATLTHNHWCLFIVSLCLRSTMLAKVSHKWAGLLLTVSFIFSAENNAYSFGRTTIANLDAEWVIHLLSLYFIYIKHITVLWVFTF